MEARTRLSALAVGLALACGPAWGGKSKLPAMRGYSTDLTISVPLPPGWNSSPHELGHMNDSPRDLWLSNEKTSQEVRFNNTDQSWERLRSLYSARGSETYATETGIKALLRFKDNDVSGALECFGSRWELRGHGVTYAELRYFFDNMACRTTKAKKKAPPKKRLSTEPEP